MKTSHRSDSQPTAENVQEAGRGSPLPRLVRLLRLIREVWQSPYGIVLTAEMIREMESHTPFAITDPQERWQWRADYLNESLRDPHKMCECCNVTRDGELMDHLPSPPFPYLPNKKITGA